MKSQRSPIKGITQSHDELTYFSAGKIKRKYEVVILSFSKVRKIGVAILYNFLLFSAISVCLLSIFWSIILILILFVVWPFIGKFLLPYNRTDELLYIDKGKIYLEEHANIICEVPISEIREIRVWQAIEDYSPHKFNWLSNSHALWISFIFKDSTIEYCILNKLYETEDDQNQFREAPPTFYSTLEEISDMYGVALLSKKGKPINW